MLLRFSLDGSISNSLLNKLMNIISTRSDSGTPPSRLASFAQANTGDDIHQFEFQYSSILSGSHSLCQTSAWLNSTCPYIDECVVIVFPFNIFEKKCPRDTENVSSDTPIHAVCTNEHCCSQSLIDHHKTTSTNYNHPNQIQQRSRDDEEEIQFGLQATPSFNQTTDECASVGACARALEIEKHSCSKNNQQAQDTNTHLPTPSIVPFDNEASDQRVQPREEINNSSLAIVPSETVTPLPASTVQIDPNDTGEITIYSL